jgi:L-lactate dehydrogenase complex protein LldG
VVRENQVINDLEELYIRLQWEPEHQSEGLTNCMTFICAPSKTGDIELVMVNGAHGPREVHLIVIRS